MNNIEDERPDCPKCKHADFVAWIQYGLPAKEAFKEENCKNIVFGGCVVSLEQWYCRKHRLAF